MENEYCIKIDGREIPVTEEVFREYKRPEWRSLKVQEFADIVSIHTTACWRMVWSWLPKMH